MNDCEIICYYCGGEGYLVYEGYVECPYCDGSGLMMDFYEE